MKNATYIKFPSGRLGLRVDGSADSGEQVMATKKSTGETATETLGDLVTEQGGSLFFAIATAPKPTAPLANERLRLVYEVSRWDDAYPGSRDWGKLMAAEAELQAFDARHPEVIESARSDRRAKDAAATAARVRWI